MLYVTYNCIGCHIINQNMYDFTEKVFMTNVLNQHVMNSNREEIETYIKKESEGAYYLFERSTNEQLGYIDFDIIRKNNRQLIFINDMESYSRNLGYKGVGSLLHEFVFYVASQLKECCALQLTVAYQSHIFHYKCGFRFKNDADNLKIEALITHLNAERNTSKAIIKQLPECMYMPENMLKSKIEQYKLHTPSNLLPHQS